MEAVDVIEEDGLGRKADPAREAEERGVHEEPEGREEERLVDDDDPRGGEEERMSEAKEERGAVREEVVEAEVEAAMDGETAKPAVEVIEAPVEDSRTGDEVPAEAGCVRCRTEPTVETRSGAEPAAAAVHPGLEAADVHPTAKARASESQSRRAGE